MRKFGILMLSILLFTGAISADKFYGELKAHYLFPSDEIFRDVYKGGINPQLEFGMRLLDRVEVSLDIGWFARTGELTLTKEETRVSIISFSLSCRYLIAVGDFTPYAGVGFSYNLYNEESEVFDPLSGNGIGFVLRVGGYFKLSDKLKSDLFLTYDNCQMEPGAVKFNIGGIRAGLGLRYNF